jgi:hypothetical protein
MGVPNLPGVPTLASYSSTAGLFSSLLTSDGAGVYSASSAVQWGIYLNGASVVEADTVTSFSYKQEWAIADFPLEQGAFNTYDKVSIPFEARVRFTAGGSEQRRQALLDSIAAIAGDQTNLYTIITPEATYPSVTISHYDYARTAVNGLGMLSVDVWVFNAIVSGTISGQDVASPSAASQQNDGPVSPSAGSFPATLEFT